MKNTTKKKLYAINSMQVLVVLFGLILTACNFEDITIPESDDTLPTVGCTVVVGGENITLHSGGDDVQLVLSANDDISIIAIGEDADGGVKSTCIVLTIKLYCTNGDYSQQKNYNIPPICSADNKQPGEVSKKKKAITHVIHLSEYVDECQSGYWITKIIGSIKATVENYHYGTDETGTLSFDVNEINSRDQADL